MKTHLAPLIGLHPDVKINQCIEYVISKPIDRNGQVFITRDRSADRPIKLSIQEFEDQTGTYIVGLEPTYEYCLTNLIAEFAKDIETRDFNRIPNHLYYGEIKFSTDRNTIVEVSVHLMNVTEGYTVSVRRNAGGMNKIKRFVGPEGALPLLLDNALRVIDEYITTKVQILSKAEDTTTPIDRQYSEEGFAILRTNESLNDYFKEGRNNKKAGIVGTYYDNYESVGFAIQVSDETFPFILAISMILTSESDIGIGKSFSPGTMHEYEFLNSLKVQSIKRSMFKSSISTSMY